MFQSLLSRCGRQRNFDDSAESPQSRRCDLYLRPPSREQDFIRPYCRNKIRTAKYTLISFLPLNLFEQFHRIANVYFLMIASLQQVPGVSPTGKYTTAGPLLLVMSVTAIKEAYEDYKRHVSDSEVNRRQVDVVEDGKFVPRLWKNIMVGDIVRVKSDSYFPADLVLFSSSEKSGICYIQTANLDGEVNLKVRQSLVQTVPLSSPDGFEIFTGYIESELPNNNLHKFEGTLHMGSEKFPLDSKQFLPRV